MQLIHCTGCKCTTPAQVHEQQWELLLRAEHVHRAICLAAARIASRPVRWEGALQHSGNVEKLKKKKKNLVFVRHKGQNCAVGGGWRRGEVWGQQWAFAAQPELRMPMRRWNSLSPSAGALRKAVTKLAAIKTLWRLYFGIRYSRHNHLHFVSQNHKTAWVKKDLRHHLCMPQSTSTM